MPPTTLSAITRDFNKAKATHERDVAANRISSGVHRGPLNGKDVTFKGVTIGRAVLQDELTKVKIAEDQVGNGFYMSVWDINYVRHMASVVGVTEFFCHINGFSMTVVSLNSPHDADVKLTVRSEHYEVFMEMTFIPHHHSDSYNENTS